MNPKGVPTKGMWIKVFVKALPYTADRLTDKFLFIGERLIQTNNKYIITLRRGNNELKRIHELLYE